MDKELCEDTQYININRQMRIGFCLFSQSSLLNWLLKAHNFASPSLNHRRQPLTSKKASLQTQKLVSNGTTPPLCLLWGGSAVSHTQSAPLNNDRNQQCLRLGPRPWLCPTQHHCRFHALFAADLKRATSDRARVPYMLPSIHHTRLLRHSCSPLAMRPHCRNKLPLRMAPKSRLLPALPHENIFQTSPLAAATSVKPAPDPSFTRIARVGQEISCGDPVEFGFGFGFGFVTSRGFWGFSQLGVGGFRGEQWEPCSSHPRACAHFEVASIQLWQRKPVNLNT